MNLLDAISQAQGGQGISNLASKFGLSPEQTQQAVGALIPQIVAGMKNQSGGLGSIIGMLSSGAHADVASSPGQAFGQQGVSLGNEVLGQIFGSKEVSSAVAGNVSQQTGVGADVVRQMLPMVTTMIMGALAQKGLGGMMGGGSAQSPAAGAAGMGGLGGMLGGLLGAVGGGAQAQGGASSAATSMLSSILDANHDGSVADDLMKLAGGFFSKR